MTTRVSAGPVSTGALARIAALASGSAKGKVEDDKDKDKAEGGDDKDKDKAEGGDDKDKDKAEGGDDKDKDAKDDKDDKDANGKKKGKKAEGEDDEASSDKDDENCKDGDDDSDEDDKANKSARAARRRERGRIASILTSPAATRSSNSFAMAVNLALNTQMTRGEAIAVISGMPDAPAAAEPQRNGSSAARDRLAQTPSPRVSTEPTGEGTRSVSMADQIIAAGKKRRGEVA